jgi:exodeoxyribonuclease V alpha subunit
MPPSTLTVLMGQIERITFTSDETGYTVAKVKVYGHRDLVTVIGAIINPTPGEVIRMKGEWGHHPKYGEQFKIVFCETKTPATVHGIEKYLGSGLVKGTEPVMAKRIAKRFKEETLNVNKTDISKLAEVKGNEMIRKAWEARVPEISARY